MRPLQARRLQGVLELVEALFHLEEAGDLAAAVGPPWKSRAGHVVRLWPAGCQAGGLVQDDRQLASTLRLLYRYNNIRI